MRCRTLNNFLFETASEYSVLPAAQAIVNRMQELTDRDMAPFISTEDQTGRQRPGQSKVETETKLVNATLVLVSGLRSLAAATTPRPEWAERVSLTRSDLTHVPDLTTLTRCEEVYGVTKENAGNLRTYLIEEEDLKQADELLDAFATQIGQARNVRSQGTAARTGIERLLQEYRALMLKLTETVAVLEFKKPDWWTRFEAAKTLVDPGAGGKSSAEEVTE
jgi:hypothetical protein